MGELLLREREKEVRLVLGGVDAAQQPPSAGRLLPGDAGVVTGGHGVRPERGGAVAQLGELQFAVAVRARQGRPPGQILVHEVGDHRLLEPPFQVDDVMRDAERRRHAACVVQIVEGAAGSEGGPPLGLVVELHRQANHVPALLLEQGGGHRGVDASRHRDDDAPESGSGHGQHHLTARNRCTTDGTTASTRSISSAVVVDPRLKRIDDWTRPCGSPIARRT